MNFETHNLFRMQFVYNFSNGQIQIAKTYEVWILPGCRTNGYWLSKSRKTLTPFAKVSIAVLGYFFDSLLTFCLFIDFYSKKSQKGDHFSYLKCSKHKYTIFKCTKKRFPPKRPVFEKKKIYYLTNTNNRATLSRDKIEP